MAETPQEIYERAAPALRTPAVDEWDTFPFQGRPVPRPLEPPLACEAPRAGEGGINCRACVSSDESYMWSDARWRLQLPEPSGLPLVLILEPRQHLADPGDLPDELAAEFGILTGRVERAMREISDIGRVHVCRWGDGAEHLHWWFMARPARLGQLASSFAAIWDDILPPTPQHVWADNAARFLEAFTAEQ